jgi:hypothetical protein
MVQSLQTRKYTFMPLQARVVRIPGVTVGGILKLPNPIAKCAAPRHMNLKPGAGRRPTVLVLRNRTIDSEP